jgi:hypothetical protein
VQAHNGNVSGWLSGRIMGCLKPVVQISLPRIRYSSIAVDSLSDKSVPITIQHRVPVSTQLSEDYLGGDELIEPE